MRQYGVFAAPTKCFRAVGRVGGWQPGGSAPIEKAFRNVEIRRDGCIIVSFWVKKEIPDGLSVLFYTRDV